MANRSGYITLSPPSQPDLSGSPLSPNSISGSRCDLTQLSSMSDGEINRIAVQENAVIDPSTSKSEPAVQENAVIDPSTSKSEPAVQENAVIDPSTSKSEPAVQENALIDPSTSKSEPAVQENDVIESDPLSSKDIVRGDPELTVTVTQPDKEEGATAVTAAAETNMEDAKNKEDG
eukprot:gene10947-3299_t